jgi:hypothetical protein
MAPGDGAWLRAELKRWTCRPGVRLEAVTPGLGLLGVRFSMRVYDSRAPRTAGELMGDCGGQEWWAAPLSRPRITVTALVEVPRLVVGNSAAFGAWLRETLGELDAHERDEWLRCDGVLIWDPHAPQCQAIPDTPKRNEEARP